MTTKERLHRLVEDLPDVAAVEAEAALLEVMERQGAATEDTTAGATITRTYELTPQTSEEEAWALANAREAIREEPW
jgi:hypothetical protein